MLRLSSIEALVHRLFVFVSFCCLGFCCCGLVPVLLLLHTANHATPSVSLLSDLDTFTAARLRLRLSKLRSST